MTYADGSRGEILYLKALLRKNLGADIYGYWRTNPEFPNQPTSNQFYGELQFDSYRELGRQLMGGIVGDRAATSSECSRAGENRPNCFAQMANVCALHRANRNCS